MDEVSHDAGALRHAAVRVRIGRGLQIASLTLTVIEVAMLVAGVPMLSLADAYSPVYAGSYRVTWHGRCAHVQVWSDSAVDPMVPLDVTASVGEGVSSRCGD